MTESAILARVIVGWPTDGKAVYLHSDGKLVKDPKAVAARHVSGDTLLDYVVLELHDVLAGEPPEKLRDRAISALRNSVKDLEEVIALF